MRHLKSVVATDTAVTVLSDRNFRRSSTFSPTKFICTEQDDASNFDAFWTPSSVKFETKYGGFHSATVSFLVYDSVLSFSLSHLSLTGVDS